MTPRDHPTAKAMRNAVRAYNPSLPTLDDAARRIERLGRPAPEARPGHGAAFERTLRLLRHSLSDYAHGYRVGAGVQDWPPSLDEIEARGLSASWWDGYRQARQDALAFVSDSAGLEDGAGV